MFVLITHWQMTAVAATIQDLHHQKQLPLLGKATVVRLISSSYIVLISAMDTLYSCD